MKTLGNILWFFFGGAFLALCWFLSGLVCCITIIGIPLGLQCFKFASLMLWPFGKDIIYRGGTGSFILNVLWIIFFGWELALSSLIIGLVWCITIVGIPFGLQSIKFARLALMPFGADLIQV